MTSDPHRWPESHRIFRVGDLHRPAGRGDADRRQRLDLRQRQEAGGGEHISIDARMRVFALPCSGGEHMDTALRICVCLHCLSSRIPLLRETAPFCAVPQDESVALNCYDRVVMGQELMMFFSCEPHTPPFAAVVRCRNMERAGRQHVPRTAQKQQQWCPVATPAQQHAIRYCGTSPGDVFSALLNFWPKLDSSVIGCFPDHDDDHPHPDGDTMEVEDVIDEFQQGMMNAPVKTNIPATSGCWYFVSTRCVDASFDRGV